LIEMRRDADGPANRKIFPRTFTTSSPQGCSSTLSGSESAKARTFSRALATRRTIVAPRPAAE
jgi:hypothetical protein